jgi:hypothetical protein
MEGNTGGRAAKEVAPQPCTHVLPLNDKELSTARIRLLGKHRRHAPRLVELEDVVPLFLAYVIFPGCVRIASGVCKPDNDESGSQRRR